MRARRVCLPLFGIMVSAGTAAIPLHAQAGTAYVTSEKDAAVTLVDTTSPEVKGTFTTCKRGRHIQRLPDGTLMLACTGSNAADVVDPVSGRSVRRIPLGDKPEAVVVSPDGKTVYASNEDAGSASFVDAHTGKMLKTVKIGQEPEGVKVSADGRTLYVTSEVANTVHVIDVGTGQLVKNIKVGKRPRRMAMTPDGQELWVTCEMDASINVIATADHTVVATLRFPLKGARAEDITPVGITMSRNGKRAFVALGRSNHVAFIDVPGRQVSGFVPVGKWPWNVTLDQAERRLWAVNGLSDDVTVVDIASAKALKSIRVGRAPYGLALVE